MDFIKNKNLLVKRHYQESEKNAYTMAENAEHV